MLNIDASTSSDATPKSKAGESDPYYLHGSNHLGLVLVLYQFTGTNFLSWKRSMILALGAKTKLQFINGDLPKPSQDDERYAIWKKVDWTVSSWILNILSKDLSETFVHTEFAK